MIALFVLAGTLFLGCLAGAALSLYFSRRQVTRAKIELQAETASLREMLDRPAAPFVPSPPVNAFNLNRRPEAVRRLRANQPLDNIAAGTGWTVPELALLEKIEKVNLTLWPDQPIKQS